MKRWELRCYLDDGRVAQCDVPLELEGLRTAAAVPLIKQRLYEAYVAVEHFMQPAGPELPPELKNI